MSDADLIKVVIIKDKNEIREGLRTLIHGTPAHRCTGAFRSMEEALERIGQEVPTVILVDIGLAGMSQTESQRVFFLFACG